MRKYGGTMRLAWKYGGGMAEWCFYSYLIHEETSSASLAPWREMEYTLFEQSGLAVLMVVLVFFMLETSAVALRWRWTRGVTYSPLLLIPSWRTVLQTFCTAIVLPIGIYYLYTRWSPLAGREYSLVHQGHRAPIETLLLGTTMLCAVYFSVISFVRTRCVSLAIAVPEKGGFGKLVLLIGIVQIIAFGLWISFLFGSKRIGAVSIGSSITHFFALGFLLVQLRLIAHIGGGVKKYGCYYGTVARAVIPLCAAAIIFLGAVVQPCLRRGETALIQNRAIWPMLTDNAEFAMPEIVFTNILKAETETVIAEINAAD